MAGHVACTVIQLEFNCFRICEAGIMELNPIHIVLLLVKEMLNFSFTVWLHMFETSISTIQIQRQCLNYF